MPTTIRLRDNTLERIKEIRPYDSLSHDEFINTALDAWESHSGEVRSTATETGD